MTPVTEPKTLRDAAIQYLAGVMSSENIARLNINDIKEYHALIAAWTTARNALNPPTPALFVSLHWGHGAGPNLRRLSARSVRRIIAADIGE